MDSGGRFDLARKEDEIRRLEALTEAEDFWKNPNTAQQTLKTLEALKNAVSAWQEVAASMQNSEVSIELLAESEDPDLLRELEKELTVMRDKVAQLRFQKMLSAEGDVFSAVVTINAGAGGTESCDWVSILLRMYLRYCESKGWQTEIVDFNEGEQAGYKSVTFLANGKYAYGYLKAENGVHRLVRISPFDANKRRHTSFASVFVSPQVDDTVEVDVKDSDVRVDTFRAGGAGGQHVNKTSSAVRMTHISTGIVVQCQSDRSQHKNRATALKLLRAKLYEREMEKKRAEQAEVESQKKRIEWGSQIRSYVLQPYQLVKDLRTNYETGNVGAILDGDLDAFIEAYLLSQ